MIKVIFAVGSALMTIGSVINLGKKATHFAGRIKHHDHPQYTKQNIHYKPRTENHDSRTYKR